MNRLDLTSDSACLICATVSHRSAFILTRFTPHLMNSQMVAQKDPLCPNHEELRRELELTLQLTDENASPEND